MNEDFSNNQNRAKESSLVRDVPVGTTPAQAADEIDPVAPTMTPKKHKRNTVHEIFRAVFPGGFEEIKQHLLWDIFIPWLQDTAHNAWQGLGDVAFPGSGRTAPKTSNGVPEYYSYNDQYRYSNYNQWTASNGYIPKMRPTTKERCNEILESLHESIMRVGYATLLEFNSEVGIETYYTQRDYGWMSIRGVEPIQVRGGWIIPMPKAVPIDDARRY